MSALDSVWAVFERRINNEQEAQRVNLIDLAKARLDSASSIDAAGDAMQTTFNLAIDAEDAPGRLYGGYFNDFVCGGDWNRMTQYLNALHEKTKHNHMEMVVFFDGSIGDGGEFYTRWYAKQLKAQDNNDKVFRFMERHHLPPSPKPFWLPPAGLHLCLRLALRHLNTQMIQTMSDHRGEVVSCVLRSGKNDSLEKDDQMKFDCLLGCSAMYVICCNRIDLFSAHTLKLTYRGVIESCEVDVDWFLKFVGLQRKHLALLGTLLGGNILSTGELSEFHSYAIQLKRDADEAAADSATEGKHFNLIRSVANYVKNVEVDDLEKMAAEVADRCALQPATTARKSFMSRFKRQVAYYKDGYNGDHKKPAENKAGSIDFNPAPGSDANSARQSAESASPPSPTVSTTKHVFPTNCSNNDSARKLIVDMVLERLTPRIPAIDERVRNVVLKQHSKALITPCIYHIITKGEILLKASLECNSMSQQVVEMPQSVYVYRVLRANAYAILFDVRSETDAGKVEIREWYVKHVQSGCAPAAELVAAKPLSWTVPPVHTLWLGTDSGDWLLRMKAFLTCFRSDSPMMLSSTFVEPHHFVLCVVLRYLLTYAKPLLYEFELDAFILQAISPMLHNTNYLQDLKLQRLSCRGVQLATLFMRGVEHAVLVNEVCGLPVQWQNCCPWLFFDGKLFHSTLLGLVNGNSFYNMCNGNPVQIRAFQNLRLTILDNLEPNFLKPRVVAEQQARQAAMRSGAQAAAFGAASPFPAVNLRNEFRREERAELVVAGEVVGQWGRHHSNSYYNGAQHPPPKFVRPKPVKKNKNNKANRQVGGGEELPKPLGRGAKVIEKADADSTLVGSALRKDFDTLNLDDEDGDAIEATC